MQAVGLVSVSVDVCECQWRSDARAGFLLPVCKWEASMVFSQIELLGLIQDSLEPSKFKLLSPKLL
jgi:hypothetical protein